MAQGDIAIRAVEAGDVGEVVTLLRAVLAEFGLTFGEGSATDAQVLALPGSYRDHGGHFWVARDAGGVLLGTCGVFPVAPRSYELRKMYLDARARGRGVGARLLDAAETLVSRAGGPTARARHDAPDDRGDRVLRVPRVRARRRADPREPVSPRVREGVRRDGLSEATRDEARAGDAPPPHEAAAEGDPNRGARARTRH